MVFCVHTYPPSGGCEIGPRPIDLHLKAIRSMGAKVDDTQGGFIHCEAQKLKGCDINLDYPSVGATENIMLASAFAEGETSIMNAAREPEIVDLQNYLTGMGVKVTGAGTSVVRISGGMEGRLSDVEHTIITDRIVAGTYMIAAAVTHGDLVLKNVIPEHVASIASLLREAGCGIETGRNSIHIIGPKRLKGVGRIRTQPYPGFPTDMQAQMVAAMTLAEGTSVMIETVFENRYRHVDELVKMGASIDLDGRTAVIQGVKRLVGASVRAHDLRGGAALVIAALAAEGMTEISDIKHIDRGYEKIEEKLSTIGSNIRRIVE